MIRIAILPALAAAAFLFTAAAAQEAAEPATEPGATLSVTGRGTAAAQPDIATIRLGVETQAEKPADALSENTAAVERIIARIKEAGVEGRDVQTVNFSVYPVYDHRRMEQEGGAPVVAGFRVSNEVVARIRDLEGMGAVLTSVIDAGANRINSLSFDIDDPAPLEAEARRAAVKDARARAELYAEAAGLRLVRVLSLNEGFSHPPMPVDQGMRRMAMVESAADVPIERGENALEATVSMVWEVAPAE